MAKGSVSFFPVNHDPWADLPKGPTEARQGPMSWTDYLPFVKDAVKIYGKEKLGEILGAVTAPGDALAGRLDPGTPEGLKRVQTLAGLAMGGPSKPQGSVGAGWQFPHKKAGLFAEGYFAEAEKAAIAKGKGFLENAPDETKLLLAAEKRNISLLEAAQKMPYSKLGANYWTNLAHKITKETIPEAKDYSHPHDTPISEHPATYGMSDPEARAASELLEAMKLYPDQYKTPKEALQGLEEFAEPQEILHFESAAKKLEDWAGPHGFKFQEEPLLSQEEINSVMSQAKELGVFSSFPKPAAYTPPATIPIEEALYPINWADLHSTVRRPGQEAAGPYADTLRRAEALGFNTNFPLYHGALDTKVKAPANPAEGIWGPAAEQYHSFGDPKKMKDEERGIFTTDTPEIAAQYSGGSDADVGHGQTFPLFANPKKTLAVDWTAVSGDPSYRVSIMNKLIEAAYRREADALVIQGMQDMGGPQNQYVFLRPNVLRSQFAMFDPKKADSANLLHAGGLGALPLFIPIDHDPFSEPTQ